MPYSVYAFGSNGSGQLGIGHDEDVSIPTKCVVPDGYLHSEPAQIAAGGNHTVVLCQDNTAYIAGASHASLAGAESPASDEVIKQFRQILPPTVEEAPKFKLCAATWESTILVTMDNQIYTCGNGQKGELGQGEDATSSPEPRLLRDFPPENTSVIDVSSCMAHTVVVLSNGDVYGWGNGRKGQLGEPAGVIWQPRKITPRSFKAARAACGREFTCIFGDRDGGQMTVLGSDKGNIKSAFPVPIGKWVDIGASWGSAYVLREDGSLVSWGRDDHGQLTPAGTPKLQRFAAGSEHVLAETVDGAIITWGWGEHGNCGEQPPDDPLASEKHWIPIQPPMQGVQILGAGCATSWLKNE